MLESLKIFGMVWVALVVLCVLVVAAPLLEKPIRRLRKLVRWTRHPLRRT